jgi:hypothetical protein
MEPAIHSILTLQPDFDLQSVDVIGCGSTLGNLLRFAGSQSKPFRFDVDLIGETVFFVRKENSPTELIQDLRGYGHTFPERYTTWDAGVRNSCSHQRIIQYEFGGLRFLVRSETDGYVKSSRDTPSSSTKSIEKSSLEDALDNLTVSISTSASGKQLQLRKEGFSVPQDQIFDIKTRAQQNIFDMDEILPRLWVNQTPKFLVAYHRFGLFHNPVVSDVRQEVLRWQKENSSLLGRFHALVKRIVDAVRDSDNMQVEVSWDGQGPLCITKQIGEERRALPHDLRRLWTL